MQDSVKKDLTARFIRHMRQQAETINDRAALFEWTPRYQRMLESGRVPLSWLKLIHSGLLALAPDTELAHETNDTKGADDDSHPC